MGVRDQIGRLTVSGLLFLLPSLALATGPIDWFQPPVGCVEDFVAQPDLIPCLDLSSVKDPLNDLPSNLTAEQLRFWTVDHKPDLTLCRSKEVMRRERLRPGSQSATAVYIGYMRSLGGEKLREKMNAIYETSALVEMPPQILFGALFQESVLAELMISVDGGNYSCGIAQLNLYEWCHGITSLPESEQVLLGWPVGISCELLAPNQIAPFHEIALKRAEPEKIPEYRLQRSHYARIRFEDVMSRMAGSTPERKRQVYRAAYSFTQNCSDYRLGIYAKGKELRRLFDRYVPTPMKEVGVYSPADTFHRQCREPYPTKYTPLHTGWLLADAVYNAGSREVDLVHHYHRIGSAEPEASIAWASLTPLDLIEALHWGGKYNPATKSLEFFSRTGNLLKQTWFKSCVVQRHIARVIQYVTLPGETIARSLEISGCVQGTTPAYRQGSPGMKVTVPESKEPSF